VLIEQAASRAAAASTMIDGLIRMKISVVGGCNAEETGWARGIFAIFCQFAMIKAHNGISHFAGAMME